MSNSDCFAILIKNPYYLSMRHTKFFSKEVNPKRLRVLISFTVIAPILILILGFYYYDLIDTSLKDYYSRGSCNTYENKKKELSVLGTADTSRLSIDDYDYYNDADLIIQGEWKPKEYIEIERAIDNPEYDVKAGSISKDTFDIGNGNILNLVCGEINEHSLEIPPYWSSCTLKMNDYYTFSTDIRSDIYCKDYGDYDDPNGCTEEVGIVLYSDPDLDSQYLFLSSGEWVGSPYAFSAYQIDKDYVSKLYFDFGTFIDEEKMVRGGLDAYNLYLAFTDSTKKNFKLVTYFYDPSMRSITGIYDEFIVKNTRFLLDKKIVSQYLQE